MKSVDARGFACPRPVLMTDEAIKSGENDIIVFVDNKVAEMNVTNHAEKNGYKVTHEREGRDFKLVLKK